MDRRFSSILRLFAALSMILGIGNHAVSLLGADTGDDGTLLLIQATAFLILAEILDMRRERRHG